MVGNLSKVGENDIKGFFSMFGEIESVDVEFQRVSGENKGQAIVHFIRSSDAQAAIHKMNGFIISDTPIIVTKLPYNMIHGLNGDMAEDNRRSGHSSLNRAYLANKLAGNPDERELNQKQEKDDVEALKKKIRRDKHSSFDPSRVLGLFNLVEKSRAVNDTNYVDEIVEDVKSKLTRRVL